MTTKVGAARIRPISDVATRAQDAAAQPHQAPAEPPSARPTTSAMAAISKLTTMPARSCGRKSARDSCIADHATACRRSSQDLQLAAQPDHDHHHDDVEDEQQRVGRGAAAGEGGDVGERAQQLGRADEARDRRALGGVDQERHDLRRRAADARGRTAPGSGPAAPARCRARLAACASPRRWPGRHCCRSSGPAPRWRRRSPRPTNRERAHARRPRR